jgi:hypothetical protein
MKVVKQTPNELILKENILMTRLLGVFFVVISSFAGTYISMNYTESVKPALILSIIFFTIGLIILFFLTARLQYHIDKTTDSVKIGYPVRFATGVEFKEFKLSELKSIQFKHAIGPSSTDSGFKGPRNMKGFDFELESGELVHCGIYSTSAKEIIEIIQKILAFKNIPIVDSKKKEILWV